MRERECYAKLDMVYRDRQTGASYHVTKTLVDKLGNLIGFELLCNDKKYTVTGEWMNDKIKSRRLEYMKTLVSPLGYEYNAVTKVETFYVIN